MLTESAIYKKAYLELYKGCMADVLRNHEEYLKAHARIEGVKIAQYGLSRAGKKMTFDDWVCELDAICGEYAKAEREAAERKSEIENYLLNLTEPDERTVMELRYLSLLSWEGIAKQTHYSRSWVHELHDRALEKLPYPKSVDDTGRHNLI